MPVIYTDLCFILWSLENTDIVLKWISQISNKFLKNNKFLINDDTCAMFYKVKRAHHYLMYVKQMGINISYKNIATLRYEVFHCE